MKAYNVIFPIWWFLFMPPILFVSLIGNFIIDSIVIIACFYIFKISKLGTSLTPFYKKSILKVWFFGFLADIIGAAILFLLSMFGNNIGIPNEWVSTISYDPFRHPMAVVIVVLSMLVASAFIFIFNYKITFKRLIEDEKVRFKVALTIAIVTIPWTFLLPTRWFY